MIRVQQEDFSVADLYAALREQSPNAGAIVTFTGLVREFYQGAGDGPRVQTLYLEHYPGMTEKALQDIVDQASARWEVIACQVIHRVGELQAGEQIVYVGVAGTHRGEAFAAGEFIMDYLKTRAPFWKRQQTDEGSGWIESRASDDEARSRWEN